MREGVSTGAVSSSPILSLLSTAVEPGFTVGWSRIATLCGVPVEFSGSTSRLFQGYAAHSSSTNCRSAACWAAVRDWSGKICHDDLVVASPVSAVAVAVMHDVGLNTKGSASVACAGSWRGSTGAPGVLHCRIGNGPPANG